MANQPNHYPSLPANLPWHTSQAILLLDGVSIENLLAKIYSKASQNKIECLYINTRWEGLKDISPCAILLTSDQGPLLKDYLAQLNEETGYLFFSKAPWQQIITHLRWLIEVTEPTQQSLMLRFADPAVMVALLKTKKNDLIQKLMGPIDLLVLPDSITEQWHLIERPNLLIHQAAEQRYQLTEENLEQLGETSFRQTVKDLKDHMQAYFPHYLAGSTNQEQYNKLYRLANNAYQQGYCSEQDITYYANIIGYLGEDYAVHYPDLATLINRPNQQQASERIQQAAELARQYATR